MTTYETDVNGKYIPATQRPDGTWRKARRVKDGYTPQEEVPVYQSKAKKLQAQRPPGIPVGMCPLVAQAEKERQLKKQKQKEKEQQKPRINPTPGLLNITSKFEPVKKPKNSSKNILTEDSGSVQPDNANNKLENQHNADTNELTDQIDELNIDERQEIAKKLKKLRKKLREIEDIESRLKSGDLTKPEKDQMEKVGKKLDILTEIQELEAARNCFK